ncbi:co-chaperone GroES [Candidatus Sarmatiella mevalonica]
MLKFEPLYDRIAVEPLPLEEKTAGGIIIPDSAKEKPMRGKVVAVGQGARNDKGDLVSLRVKVGDVVVYGKWAGTEVKLDSYEIIVMKESDVMGILS